jgi:hypothetical protein
MESIRLSIQFGNLASLKYFRHYILTLDKRHRVHLLSWASYNFDTLA